MHLDARGHTPSPSGVGRRVAAPSAIRREPDPTAQRPFQGDSWASADLRDPGHRRPARERLPSP